MRNIILFLVLITNCLAVSIFELSLIHYVFLYLFGVLGCGVIFFLNLDIKLFRFLNFYLSPFLLSLFISLPVNYIFNDKYDYTELNIVGRLLNIFILTIIVLYIDFLVKKKRFLIYNLFKFYFITCVIMLLSALWQIAYLYFGFPFDFPIETRSLVHSTNSTLTFQSRVTGLAQEPSYLAPYLIDTFILVYILFKKKWLKIVLYSIIVFVVVLTLSPSAYISLAAVGSILVFKKSKIFHKFIIVPFLLLIAIFFIDISKYESLLYFGDRLTSASDSGRFQVIFKAINLVIEDGNVFTILFGNGMKSFQIINTINGYQDFLVTSNNLFVDVFFEAGLIGLFLIFFFLFYTFKKIGKIIIVENRIIGYLFFCDLVISSLFRADFATFRFFLLLYFIFIFIHSKVKLIKNED